MSKEQNKKIRFIGVVSAILVLVIASCVFVSLIEQGPDKVMQGMNQSAGVSFNADPDDPTRMAEFDSLFKIPFTISGEHHETHEGASYERHVDSGNVATSSLNATFKTAAGTKRMHILVGWSSDDETLFEIIEGATWTQGTGLALDVFNLRRDITASSSVIQENVNQPSFTANSQVMKDVAGISGGTTFENQYTYNAGLPQSKISESRAGGHEWILKPDTTYIIRLTQTDGNCKMSLDLHWYEHTDE